MEYIRRQNQYANGVFGFVKPTLNYKYEQSEKPQTSLFNLTTNQGSYAEQFYQGFGTSQKQNSVIQGRGPYDFGTLEGQGANLGFELINKLQNGQESGDVKYAPFDPVTGKLSLKGAAAFARATLDPFRNDQGKVGASQFGTTGAIADINADGFISDGENLAYTMGSDWNFDGIQTADERAKWEEYIKTNFKEAKDWINQLYTGHKMEQAAASIGELPKTQPRRIDSSLVDEMDMIKKFLTETNDTKLLKAINDPNLKVGLADLKDGVNAVYTGGEIYIDFAVAKQSTEKAAGLLLHELGHYSDYDSLGSIQEETDNFLLTEKFLDWTGKGEYTQQGAELETTLKGKIRTAYKDQNLPETSPYHRGNNYDSQTPTHPSGDSVVNGNTGRITSQWILNFFSTLKSRYVMSSGPTSTTGTLPTGTTTRRTSLQSIQDFIARMQGRATV